MKDLKTTLVKNEEEYKTIAEEFAKLSKETDQKHKTLQTDIQEFNKLQEQAVVVMKEVSNIKEDTNALKVFSMIKEK